MIGVPAASTAILARSSSTRRSRRTPRCGRSAGRGRTRRLAKSRMAIRRRTRFTARIARTPQRPWQDRAEPRGSQPRTGAIDRRRIATRRRTCLAEATRRRLADRPRRERVAGGRSLVAGRIARAWLGGEAERTARRSRTKNRNSRRGLADRIANRGATRRQSRRHRLRARTSRKCRRRGHRSAATSNLVVRFSRVTGHPKGRGPDVDRARHPLPPSSRRVRSRSDARSSMRTPSRSATSRRFAARVSAAA